MLTHVFACFLRTSFFNFHIFSFSLFSFFFFPSHFKFFKKRKKGKKSPKIFSRFRQISCFL
nr:MAG TPA: hypothetical protein [Caudoviricetes sp.]